MHDVQLREIDLNLLVVLDALLDTRSIKHTADRVALSPSATSHALARLRDALDDPLLVRAGRDMVLTEGAEALRPRLRRALDELQRALRAGDDIDPETLRRDFRIATSDFAELFVLAPASDAIAVAAPGVALQSHVYDGDAPDKLRSNRYDLALGVFVNLPADICQRPLFHEQFVCVLRKGHPAARRKLTAERFASLEHVLVSPRGDPRGVVDRLLEEQGLSRRVARTVTSFAVAPHLVANSDYVLTIARRVALQLAPALDLVVREPPVALNGFELSMVWHRRADDDPAHGWLRDQLAAAVS